MYLEIEALRQELVMSQLEVKQSRINESLACLEASFKKTPSKNTVTKVDEVYKLVSRPSKRSHACLSQFLLTCEYGELKIAGTDLKTAKEMVIGDCSQSFTGVLTAKNFKNTLNLLKKQKIAYQFRFEFETFSNQGIGLLFIENKTMQLELMFFVYSADNYPCLDEMLNS